MVVRGIIFDLDGTLVKDNNSLDIFNEVLVKRGKAPLSPDEAEKTRGMPIVDAFKDLFTGDEIKSAMHDYIEGYKRNELEMEVVEGVEELLLKLQDWGITLGMATNRGNFTANLILDWVGVSHYFKALIGGDDVERTKPDPEPFLKVMELLGVSPDKVVVVGDTRFDIEGGKRAGAKTILANWWPAPFPGADHDYVADTIDELERILTDLLFPVEKRGAEAELRYGYFRGREAVMKRRVKKNYRNESLDLSLRKRRTRAEARLLGEIKKMGVPSPYLYDVDLKNYTIIMERIEGRRVKEFLSCDAHKKENVLREIGGLIGKLHANHVVHGDPTTSNMILTEKGITLIDLGLGEISESIENKGVDLHLLKEILSTSNPGLSFEPVIKGYLDAYPDGKKIIGKIDEIEGRGRYR